MFMQVLSFLVANYAQIIAAVLALFVAALGVALVIPGDQPDKFLQSCVDFISKFSRKPDSK